MRRLTEVFADEWLEKRIQDCPPEAAAMVRVMLRGYRCAIRGNQWEKASAIGALLIEAAQEFKDDPDFPRKFVSP